MLTVLAVAVVLQQRPDMHRVALAASCHKALSCRVIAGPALTAFRAPLSSSARTRDADACVYDSMAPRQRRVFNMPCLYRLSNLVMLVVVTQSFTYCACNQSRKRNLLNSTETTSEEAVTRHAWSNLGLG